MPFKSKAQQRYMFAKHPRIAKRWADETKSIKNLPEKLDTENISKNAFDLGVRQYCIEQIVKKASEENNSQYSVNPADLLKITDIMKNESLDSVVRKIQNDYRLSDEEKKAMISRIRGISGIRNQESDSSTNIGFLGGGASGYGIGKLLSNKLNSLSPTTKTLMMGLMSLIGGKMGSSIQKGMSSRIY